MEVKWVNHLTTKFSEAHKPELAHEKLDLKGCATSRNFLPICKVLSFSLIFLVMMNNDLEVVPCLMILSCWVVVPSSSLVVCTVSSVLQSDTAVCDVSVVSLHTSQKHSVILYLFLENTDALVKKYIPWYFLEIQKLVPDTFWKCSLHT